MVRQETHEDIELSEAQPFLSYFLNVLSGSAYARITSIMVGKEVHTS